jgi:hypothetical protein
LSSEDSDWDCVSTAMGRLSVAVHDSARAPVHRPPGQQAEYIWRQFGGVK